MTSLPEVLAALQPIADGWRGAVPDTWLQGRTAYGGFSAALALHAAPAVVAALERAPDALREMADAAGRLLQLRADPALSPGNEVLEENRNGR